MNLTNFTRVGNQKGQSIMELVVAVGIIIFALTAIITLTLYNLVGQKVSENTIIASNLAREGIEVIRNMRDISWLGGDFSETLVLASDHTVTVVFNDLTNSWSLNQTPNTITAAPLYLKNNLYVHDASGQKTNFYRLLTIDFLCSDGSIVTSGTCSGVSVVGYRVISAVRWDDRGGKVHNYQLTDYIYDWK